MSVYNWQGRTREGAKRKGVMEAANEAAVTAQLRSQGILPVKVKVKPKDVEEIFTFLQKKVKTKDLVIFTRQFAVMIDAGLPLVQCLQILGDQTENATLAARNVTTSPSTNPRVLLVNTRRIVIRTRSGRHRASARSTGYLMQLPSLRGSFLDRRRDTASNTTP